MLRLLKIMMKYHYISVALTNYVLILTFLKRNLMNSHHKQQFRTLSFTRKLSQKDTPENVKVLSQQIVENRKICLKQ